MIRRRIFPKTAPPALHAVRSTSGTGNKTVPRKLKSALSAAARRLNVVAPSLGTRGKTYEAWLMFEIALALQPHAPVEPRNHKGASLSSGRRFYVRGGPGNIRPNNSNRANEPCHFAVTGKRWTFELHNSLNHCGHSGTSHELDLSFIDSHDAGAYRALAKSALYNRSRLAGLELKAYPPSKTLNKEIPRALFGAAVDLDPMISLKVTMSIAGGAVHRLGYPARYWLATSAKIGQPSEDFLSKYDIGAAQGIDPRNKAAFALFVAEVATHVGLYL